MVEKAERSTDAHLLPARKQRADGDQDKERHQGGAASSHCAPPLTSHHLPVLLFYDAAISGLFHHLGQSPHDPIIFHQLDPTAGDQSLQHMNHLTPKP